MPVPVVTGASLAPLTSPMPPMPPQEYVCLQPQPSSDTQPWSDEGPPCGDLPIVHGGMIDYDCTPRASQFPARVHAEYLAPIVEMTRRSMDVIRGGYASQGTGHFDVPAGAYGNVQADFQSYMMGLQDLGIPASAYNTSQYPDVDLNEFVNFDGDVATYR